MKKNLGISLLEVMFSLAVIVVLLLAATRYYGSINSSRKVNDGVQQIKTLIGAIDQWRWQSKGIASVVVSTSALAAAGLIPTSFNDANANPWGGIIIVEPVTASASGQVKITFSNVPNGDCLNLIDVLTKDSITGSCNNNNFAGIYSPS